MANIKETNIKVNHPLSPLTVEEIQEAVAILKSKKKLNNQVRFPTVALNEPPKDVVLKFKDGDKFDRQVFFVLLDNSVPTTYEAVVSLETSSVIRFEEIPNVQPGIMLEEFLECEELVKNHPDFKEALAKRGITNSDLIMVDPWSAGYFNIPENEGKRIARAICWQKKFEDDNGYAYPLTGIVAFVDLNKMEVDRIEDHGVRNMPTHDGNFYPETSESIEFRNDLKPLDIIQPDDRAL